MAKTKTKIISNLIMFFDKILLCMKKETINISNFFNNDIKREVRNKFSYKTNYYIEVK